MDKDKQRNQRKSPLLKKTQSRLLFNILGAFKGCLFVYLFVCFLKAKESERDGAKKFRAEPEGASETFRLACRKGRS